MTTTDTLNTKETVQQSIRCIEAGAELIRITAPSKKEAENLLNIKNELRKQGYKTPLVADIHFTPNAAEIAARIVEKVRINPGNYVDKKKFELIEYSDADYAEEIERITERFTPLVKICKEYGTAMRIGTNHGSLSDRIMSRYGDTPIGMVESAMEFLRIARDENYHQIVLSMKSSNPKVMVQAYRLLVQTMLKEFNECYPLHLGVTEAGDGEDGRIKSAVGIGTLLEDGLGDTIRVSLTEDPEMEIPVCKDIVKRYAGRPARSEKSLAEPIEKISYNPLEYKRAETMAVSNIGGHQVPVVVADFSNSATISVEDLVSIGYNYDQINDKWHIADTAADFIFTGHNTIAFPLPGSLKVIVYPSTWLSLADDRKYFPLFDESGYLSSYKKSDAINFIMVNCSPIDEVYQNNFVADNLDKLSKDPTLVFCFSSSSIEALPAIRRMFVELTQTGIRNPVIITLNSSWESPDEHLIHFATEGGGLLLDGMGDGLWLSMNPKKEDHYKPSTIITSKINTSGRNYLASLSIEQFINNTAFSILQATRTRISKTEYISCPSCGRTLFDLQETTARIRGVTNHLKGVKIAIMGCIVNGPGEMADADFGYVGSGPGKITLYRGKEVVKRNVNSEVAVEELINLMKESDAWIEKLT
ncbi:MAG: (E)-4-hydroxy-3-methylbut-2-enyl-diphosphate synthase [Flavisolibacter sp.]